MKMLMTNSVEWFSLHLNKRYIINRLCDTPEYLYDFNTNHPYFGEVKVRKYIIDKESPRTFVGYFDERDSNSPITLHNSLGPSYEDSERVGFSLQGEKMSIRIWSDKIKYLSPVASEQEIMKYLMMYDG